MLRRIALALLAVVVTTVLLVGWATVMRHGERAGEDVYGEVREDNIRMKKGSQRNGKGNLNKKAQPG